MSDIYYRINWSLDSRDIGKVNGGQAEKALYPGSIWDTAIPKNNLFMRMNESTVITQTPVLSLQAKRTDLISGSALGSGLELMISDKLKKILARQDAPDIQFFSMQVMHRKELIPGYWIVHPASVNLAPIDFTKSAVKIFGNGGQIRDIFTEDLSAFNKKREAISSEAGYLFIDRLVIKENFNQSFFHLNFVRGGVGYFVSEAVKDEIEEAHCTGIVFTGLNEKYP